MCHFTKQSSRVIDAAHMCHFISRSGAAHMRQFIHRGATRRICVILYRGTARRICVQFIYLTHMIDSSGYFPLSSINL